MIKTILTNIVFVSVMTCCGQNSVNSWLSIFNRTPADDKWPSAVALLRDDFLFCSGSLVHPKVIVTAVHCIKVIDENKEYLPYFEVRFGPDGNATALKIENHYVVQSYDYIIDFRLDGYNRDYGYFILNEEINEI